MTPLPTSCDAEEVAKGQLDDGQILDEGSTTLSGHAAYSVHFIDDNSEGPGVVESLSLVVESDEDPCYQLSLTASHDGFDTYRPDAEAMFGSFRFTTEPETSS